MRKSTKMDKKRLPETVLARIWEEQSFRAEYLHTTEGREIQILRRGQRNPDSGPDFRQALIRIGDQVHAGDVELHLEITDWQSHGHDCDPAYNQTILHVVLWPLPRKDHATRPRVLTAAGQSVPTMIVHDCLLSSLEQLVQRFEQADFRKHAKIQRCQSTLHIIPFDVRLAHLQHLGTIRLEERVKRFAAWLEHDSFEQVLYQAICEGFGYLSNKRPFLELARCLPLDYILSHLPDVPDSTTSVLSWIQAMLFGASGLLPSQEEPSGLVCEHRDPETEEYITELQALWDMLAPCLDVKPLLRAAWHFFRLRPPNFPTRRIAALSYLIRSYSVQPVFEGYLRLFTLFRQHSTPTAQRIHFLEHTLEIPATGYWKGRYLFGEPVFSNHDLLFLGRSRIRDILISAVLPVMLLYARRSFQSELEAEILALYAHFPAPSWNRITKIVTAQLFELQGLTPHTMTASVYQGMLHLYKHYCYLPACASCPFTAIKNS
ncbi:hypothetical protein U27_06793 [Candidatus Vecturithrix granuli]|uniref:DUF2851 family protein n=1 Tax=Vecturithrix granuli TaxID=1499967 RepID=A0A081C5F2_VECG1|nr:hypothetical protein U27_06793 [Candidatus Vecturithrix granuli]